MKKLGKILVSLIAIIALLINPAIAYAADSTADTEGSGVVYLSDLDRVSTSIGYGKIGIDQNSNGNQISVYVNGRRKYFDKGIFAHAKSTLVYDLRDYNNEYDYFITYLGVDASQGSAGNLFFQISVSEDGVNWGDPVLTTDVLTASSESVYYELSLEGVNYIKLYADPNGGNGNDHAVYADAKLVNYSTYFDDSITKAEDYNADIAEMYTKYGTDFDSEEAQNAQYELKVLQREFTKRVGYVGLQDFLREDNADNKAMLDWLLNDVDVLRMFLAGGLPEGPYEDTLDVLTTLYMTYKDSDLVNEEPAVGSQEESTSLRHDSNLKLKDVYLKMILADALTFSGSVYFWADGNEYSDPVNRYEIFKKMYTEKMFIEYSSFENLTVEEMRWMFNSIIDDEEIEWLNWYIGNKLNGRTNPYAFMAYTSGYNYWRDIYYNPDNYAEFDEKYGLSQFNITEPWNNTKYSSSGNPKTWIVYEEGAVCGGLSKNGGCAWTCYNGLPNTCVSQPGHCAVLYYKTLENGDGWWELNNNISGWGYSGRTEHLSIRQMNDWGEGSYTSGYNASYILLAQAAQNEYENYEKAETILMLEDVFSDDASTQEDICRDALKAENINFSAWLDLVNLYIDNYTGNLDGSEDISFGKSSSDMLELAKEIADNLKYYPLPMYDLLKLLEPYIDAGADYYEFSTNVLESSLKDASKCTSLESIQATAVKEVANRLLDSVDTTVATFSFDGEDAGKIVLSEDYQGSNGEANVGWEYCLEDCGNAEDCDWTLVTTNEVQLTEEQLNSITPESDILIHLVGTSYAEENIFIIDILDSELPSSVFANDLENKIFGVTDAMEWRYSDDDEWTFFSEEEPILTGNTTVEVRVAATGHYVASDIQTYEFNEDIQDTTRQYVSISNLSVVGASSDSNYYSGNPENAIDGNENTGWHTTWNGETDRWITIEFDKPIYLSAIEYLPMNIPSNLTNLGGIIKNVEIYTSMDGETWPNDPIATCEWEYGMGLKSIEISEPTLAKYVKIATPESYNTLGTGTANYTHAAMFNFYENAEQEVYDLQYSTTSYTNGDVKAILTVEHPSFELSESEAKDVVTGTDAEGYTTYSYTFSDNGSYTFELTYDGDVVAEIEAVVNWIDKTEPEIDITGAQIQTHAITVNLNVEDPSSDNIVSSGVESVNVRVYLDGEEITESVDISTISENEQYKISKLESDTEYTIVVEAVDAVGNSNSASKNISTEKMTNLNEDEIYAEITPSSATNQSVAVELVISDEYIQETIDNGEFKLLYSLDNGTTWSEYKGIFTLNENTVILAVLQDNAGNIGNCATLSVDNIDKTSPIVDISFVSSTSSSITIKVNAEDNDSGINNGTISISLNGKTVSATSNGGDTYTISGLSQDSKYTISVYAEDNAGNSNTANISAATNAVPSLNGNADFSINTDNIDEAYAVVTLEITDNDIKYDVDFGTYKIQYSLNDGETWETYISGVGIPVTENLNISVRLIDENENIGGIATYTVDIFAEDTSNEDNTTEIPDDSSNEGTTNKDNNVETPNDDSTIETPNGGSNTETPSNSNSSENNNNDTTNSNNVNKTYTVENLVYKIVSDKEKIVEVTGAVNKSYTTLTILSSVKIENVKYTVIGIGTDAFEDYTKLKTISIGSTVEYINKNAFKGCTNLNKVTGCKGLVTIGDDAFYKCTSLATIENSTKVTSIGEKSFAYCSKLNRIGTESGVVTLIKLKSIGSYAFYSCTSLTTVKIPSGVSSIHTKTFAKCSALTAVTGCTGITKIGTYAFYGCSKLTHVNNCSKVTSIGSKAFARCTKLVRVGTETGMTSLSKLNSLGSFAFYNCSSISKVKLPSSVTSIKTKTFVRCTSLKSVTGCSGLTDIGSYAFYKCTSLTNINNATKVTSIGAKAFAYCKSLVRIGNTTSKITLSSVKTIGDYAFYDCSKLSKVAVTSTALTSIGQASFRGCTALTSFSESSTKLKSIGRHAFYGNSKLSSITFKSSKLTSSNVGAKAFAGIKKTCTFKVPSGKGSAYKKIFIAKGASSNITVKKA